MLPVDSMTRRSGLNSGVEVEAVVSAWDHHVVERAGKRQTPNMLLSVPLP